MNPLKKTAASIATIVLIGAGSSANAAFEGRFADGTKSTPTNTCTASGQNKCTFFYDTTLDITILNVWQQTPWGPWDTAMAQASALGTSFSSALAPMFQTGWELPTGDGSQPAGPANQYGSIFQSAALVGGMSTQFNIQGGAPYFWSSSLDVSTAGKAWIFRTSGSQMTWNQAVSFGWVAVHSGDVAGGITSSVPEPETYATMLLGIAALAVATRRRDARAALREH